MENNTDLKPKAVSFEEAMIVCNERSFAMGKDLMVIDDVRSSDLESSSLQIAFLVVFYCTEGEASFSFGGEIRHMKRRDLMISLGEQAFYNIKMSADFHGTALLMSRTYAQNCIAGLNYMWPYLLYIMQHPVIPLTEEELQWVHDCYIILRRRLYKKPGRYLRETVVALTRAFYFELCNVLDSRVQPGWKSSQCRSYAIFDQFIRLVSQHFREERSVDWYSSKMCLTPKHLSEVLKLVSGKTAGQWITTLVMIEIKALLQNTDLSIKEIAMKLNFPNQSFLGKYFKNVEGISPSDFRKLLAGSGGEEKRKP